MQTQQSLIDNSMSIKDHQLYQDLKMLLAENEKSMEATKNSRTHVASVPITPQIALAMKELEKAQKTPGENIESKNLKDNGSSVQLGDLTQTMTQESHVELLQQTQSSTGEQGNGKTSRISNYDQKYD